MNPGLATPSCALVIVTRRIGDVLLSTPVFRSLKRAWPQCELDALVFAGTEGVLRGNDDIANVLSIAERPAPAAHAAFLARLLRRYPLALSLIPGDRPTLYAWLAGRRRVGLLLPTTREQWKRGFLHEWVPFDEHNTHTVLARLALLRAIGVDASPEVHACWQESDKDAVESLIGSDARRIVVLHPFPKFHYKMWHASGWQEVGRWLQTRGYRVVVTGGNEATERQYAAEVVAGLPGAMDLAGRITLGGVGYLLSRAHSYVGPDTATTHMAAACGVPTVALFGPTDPVKWGPWPAGYTALKNPWRRLGRQRVNNVVLLQSALPCVPCGLEGCERRISSYSDCLLLMQPARVIEALEELHVA